MYRQYPFYNGHHKKCFHLVSEYSLIDSQEAFKKLEAILGSSYIRKVQFTLIFIHPRFYFYPVILPLSLFFFFFWCKAEYSANFFPLEYALHLS